MINSYLKYDSKGKLISGPDSDAVFARIGEAWVVKNFQNSDQADFVLSTIQRFTGSNDGIVCQALDLPDVRWPTLRKEDLILGNVHLPFLIGLYLAPLDGWRMLPEHERPISALRLSYSNLAALSNCEIILKLAEKLEGAIAKILTSFRVDSTDEYTLEAALKEYVGEVESLLLKNRWSNISHIKSSLINLADGAQEVMALEKSLIKMRTELAENLSDLALVIEKCLHAMKSLRQSHIELDKARKGFFLLSKLVELPDQPLKMSWGHRQIALSLLLNKLQSSLITLGDWNDDRVKWAVAVQNAIQSVEERELLDILSHPQRDFPVVFQNAVKEWLKALHILPESPFQGCNPDLVRLISSSDSVV